MGRPSTGTSTERSPESSRSNHSAKGEAGPSRSTDHSARLCQIGVGIDMWLGTTSTTIPIPWEWAVSARRRSASSPPISSLMRVWSTTS